MASSGVSVLEPRVRGPVPTWEPAARRPAALPARAAGEYALILAQLAGLLFVFQTFNVESPAFFHLSCWCFGGFALWYFLPAAWKQPAFIALSLVGGTSVLAHVDPWYVGPQSYRAAAVFVLMLVGLGGIIFLCLNSGLPFGARLGFILLLAGALAYARRREWFLPEAYWKVLGAIFMFRLILYVYEVRVARRRERLSDFLGYFYLLPGFCFTLFPVIDYATFKKCRRSGDPLPTARRGVAWIVRGTVQVFVYRLLYHQVMVGPVGVHSPLTLAQFLLAPYLMYTHISGQFHIIAGMLHLFGYALPETNRRYLLAESFTDFWRRINIYWKDFMVKVFFFPAYFRLRRRGEKQALVVSTAAVFTATILLHAYQAFWLNNTFTISKRDLLFWGTLGLLVMAGVLRDARRGSGGTARTARSRPLRALSAIGVYLTVSVLWSIWSSPSLGEWVEVVTYWR
ncbi:MAG: hypothetical protein HRF43_05430 [Phycisphaerae bacterium]|jgi:hypothetical protein